MSQESAACKMRKENCKSCQLNTIFHRHQLHVFYLKYASHGTSCSVGPSAAPAWCSRLSRLSRPSELCHVSCTCSVFRRFWCWFAAATGGIYYTVPSSQRQTCFSHLKECRSLEDGTTCSCHAAFYIKSGGVNGLAEMRKAACAAQRLWDCSSV